ncbi:hypothetical protein EIN_043200 [Entamoeba invadens IP1]|uniref:Uncharacterized protein n=1 Tax=Entamoeba invadens IP1 TaxID=370355 RepID=A0A0A1TZ40_ENTIV|nr:hypothetical protein EIN_043200 [Entamoeba invadens IP1]ELP86822.1 hypothetical protein EIN_043200 [Entamoeba invadens IP1]|eukprot:XP_004253593.1 hypothetical protein EIN_043200 [Entamoeba invadens IP1]
MSQTTKEAIYSQLPIYNVLDRFSDGMWKLLNEQKKTLQKIKDEKKPRTNVALENHEGEILVFGLVSNKIDSLEEQIKTLKKQNVKLQTENEEAVKKIEEMRKNIDRYTYMDELIDDLEKDYQNDTTQLTEHYEQKLAEEKEHNVKILAKLTEHYEQKLAEEKEHHTKDLIEEKEYRAKEIRSRCDKNEKKIKILQNIINQLRGHHSNNKEFK